VYENNPVERFQTFPLPPAGFLDYRKLQEWAQHSMARCAWAHKHYDAQRARGKGHQAAVRSLAFKWIRILFRCWKDRMPYDENRYTESLGCRSAAPNTDVRIMWKNVAGFSKPAAFSA